mmetsp:Transcript_71650/g.149780  ORF Transcript_71650/g.149780 Transcript_71650/m.149780 type:complete len:86 (-) Transcript_71650:94-351(-)
MKNLKAGGNSKKKSLQTRSTKRKCWKTVCGSESHPLSSRFSEAEEGVDNEDDELESNSSSKDRDRLTTASALAVASTIPAMHLRT